MRFPPVALTLALLVLPGCPEERPGATKEIPTQRIPPAVSLEPPPPGTIPAAPPGPASIGVIAPAPSAAGGAASRKGSAAPPSPGPAPARTAPRP